MLRLVAAPLAPVKATALVSVSHAAAANTAVVTGDAWVAALILFALAALIYFLIRGTLHLEDRDTRSRGPHGRDDGWFGVFPHRPHDDAPGHHHHDGGG